MNIINPANSRRGITAYTLIEVVVASGLLGIMIVAFYGGIASGFAMVSLSREHLRANQIALERMEMIRLYSWDQVNSNGFIPPTFTAWFYPGKDADTGSGSKYFGNVTISDVPLEVAYTNSLKRVQVSLVWTNNRVARTHELETFVSEYGMQNYVY